MIYYFRRVSGAILQMIIQLNRAPLTWRLKTSHLSPNRGLSPPATNRMPVTGHSLRESPQKHRVKGSCTKSRLLCMHVSSKKCGICLKLSSEKGIPSLYTPLLYVVWRSNPAPLQALRRAMPAPMAATASRRRQVAETDRPGAVRFSLAEAVAAVSCRTLSCRAAKAV